MAAELVRTRQVVPTPYLPRIPTGSRKCASRVEPVEATPALPPRLFRSRHAAKVGLGVWLKGAVTAVITDGVLRGTTVVPVAGRHASEMEVVEVDLVLP